MHLHGNSIGDAGASSLSLALRANSFLKCFIFYDNRQVALVVPGSHSKLLPQESLYLSDNSIGDAGVCLSKDLTANSFLIFLCTVSLGDDGEACIKEALKTVRVL